MLINYSVQEEKKELLSIDYLKIRSANDRLNIKQSIIYIYMYIYYISYTGIQNLKQVKNFKFKCSDSLC